MSSHDDFLNPFLFGAILNCLIWVMVWHIAESNCQRKADVFDCEITFIPVVKKDQGNE